MKAFQYCQGRSKSIEINYKNMDGDKILTKVNFHLDPAVSWQGTELSVMWCCCRMS